MKILLAIAATLSLSGCAFAPPDAYPIFRLPTDGEAKALEQTTNQKSVFGAATDITSSQSQLMSQRLWYLQLAENSQKGVYNQSDWSLGGATLGTLGGLAKSVPTAAVGALIGGGSSMVASRYSLNGQTTTYLKGAEKVGCVWVVVSAYAAAKPADKALLPFWSDADNSVTKGALLGSLQIQTDVRTTLLTFNPTQPDPKTLVTLFKDYDALKKSEAVQNGILSDKLVTQKLALSSPMKMSGGAGVAERQASMAAHRTTLADYKRALAAAAKAATPEDKRVADIAISALSKTIEAQKVAARRRNITEALDDPAPAPPQPDIDAATANSEAAQAAKALAELQAKATNTEIALCAATGKPASATPL